MKKAILIIDDCQVTREVFGEILKKQYSVFLAETAFEGLNILSSEIGLVFLDLALPDLHGLEVLKRIKNDYPSIPVVIITAYGTEEACINAFRMGARDYIKKPFNLKEILQKVGLFMNTISTQRRRPVFMLTEDVADLKHSQGIPSPILNGIVKIKDYIDRNYTESLNVVEASKMAGMNRTYFCKYFKLITGQTFQNYLHTLKIKKAKDILRNKNLRVTEVAEHIGYSTEHFSRAFKRNFGITPRKS